MRPVKTPNPQTRLPENELSPANPASGDDVVETANGELESFNRMVAKDFLKPLTLISDYCRVMFGMHGGTLNEHYREYILKIYDETSKMSRRIDTLLNPSGDPFKKIHLETLDLGEMAKVVFEGLMWTKPDRRVKFVVALNVMARGDAKLLRVALKGLLRNAWKYTAHKEEALIEFGIAVFEEETAFFVRDNGIGFDAAETGRLFAPLNLDREIEDAGIGLDAVNKIIQSHGGRVWVDGKAGEEATFYFTLGKEHRVPSL